MIPVLTPDEMSAADEAAVATLEVLIEQAGAAVARTALTMLRGGYGRRVLVVAGKGNNGNDGRVAARHLAQAGARCLVVSPTDAVTARFANEADLIIDAAFGTGFAPRPRASILGQSTQAWSPEVAPRCPILAVDIPSGVDGLTGYAPYGAWSAHRTVTFGALKPGLLIHPGRSLAGDIELHGLGLDTGSARCHVLQAADVLHGLVTRQPESHKWQSAVWVIAGSAGMTGAALLAATGAARGGAGYVRLSTPGENSRSGGPTEAVGVALPERCWSDFVLADLQRISTIVIGPGLGRDIETLAEVRRIVALAPVPVVIDGDGLTALIDSSGTARATGHQWPAARLMTPHDGEFARLAGAPVPLDRFSAVRSLAATYGAILLLKGPTTIVASPDGDVLVVAEGDARLATAGTGDVLSGVIGALLAQGVGPLQAAAFAAFLHGRAGRMGSESGLVASDLPKLLPAAVASLDDVALGRRPVAILRS